jgi:quinoprotein glucose dehydrogenase
VNSNDYPSTEMLSEEGGSAGRSIYLSQCAACHGQNLAGIPPVAPSLVDIGKKLTAQQISQMLDTGKGRMPTFPALAGPQRERLLSYLMDVASTDESAAGPPSVNSEGYLRFSDNEGYPANSFPWGTLNAIDLNTGEYVWKIPFGEYPELVAQGMKNTGSENYGGPLVTRGGLLIIGATIFDNKLRIYDKATGKLLWEKVFPFAINATPMTYEWDGRQYIVVGCGGEGHNPRARQSGGVYYAFALPK